MATRASIPGPTSAPPAAVRRAPAGTDDGRETQAARAARRHARHLPGGDGVHGRRPRDADGRGTARRDPLLLVGVLRLPAHADGVDAALGPVLGPLRAPGRLPRRACDLLG